jgi:hypothetical protein
MWHTKDLRARIDKGTNLKFPVLVGPDVKEGRVYISDTSYRFSSKSAERSLGRVHLMITTTQESQAFDYLKTFRSLIQMGLGLADEDWPTDVYLYVDGASDLTASPSFVLAIIGVI